jgi:hypothetical protein
VAVHENLSFHLFGRLLALETSGFWKEKGANNSKNHIGLNLTLAFGAVVGSAAS